MDVLRERLEGAGMWDAKLANEIAALKKYGVDRIGDIALRDAIEGFLCIAPLPFFTDPASKSGRFHPPWQNGRHGTLRSIIESCVVLPDMGRYIPEILDESYRPSPAAIDIALAATIVSDTWKKEEDGTHYGAEHGAIAADSWRKFASATPLDPALIEAVAEGSALHFGIYMPGWPRDAPLPPIARLVHWCDAITAQTSLAIIYDGVAIVR